jgi:hypothetical protein
MFLVRRVRDESLSGWLAMPVTWQSVVDRLGSDVGGILDEVPLCAEADFFWSGVRLGHPHEGLVFSPSLVKRSRNHEVETLEALADPGDHAGHDR